MLDLTFLVLFYLSWFIGFLPPSFCLDSHSSTWCFCKWSHRSQPHTLPSTHICTWGSQPHILFSMLSIAACWTQWYWKIIVKADRWPTNPKTLSIELFPDLTKIDCNLVIPVGTIVQVTSHLLLGTVLELLSLHTDIFLCQCDCISGLEPWLWNCWLPTVLCWWHLLIWMVTHLNWRVVGGSIIILLGVVGTLHFVVLVISRHCGSWLHILSHLILTIILKLLLRTAYLIFLRILYMYEMNYDQIYS